ncbi:MAG TPA: copper amine oxidase N-terminal domain-containing protein [Firmicutes bacterium]|nr:copper amine oxidase N-terminal domain-containing protein [Bacillota bacterium]
MKLIVATERDRDAFNKYVLQKLDALRVGTEKILEGVTVYVGLNPHAELAQFNPNNRRPHYAPDEKCIVIPSLFWELGQGDVPAQAELATFFHELGHHLHFSYMGEDGGPKWRDWSVLTGQTLDFTKRDDLNYPRTPAYESFANDFQLAITGAFPVPDTLRRLRWYARLWGQDWRPRIELYIGKQEALVCGRKVDLDVAPLIIKGRTLVPVRFISECLGFDVDWEPKWGYPEKVIIT